MIVIVGVGQWVADLFFGLFFWFSGFFFFFFFGMLVSILLLSGRPEARLMMVVA